MDAEALLAACPNDDCRCKLSAAIDAATAAGIDWRSLILTLLPLVIKIIEDLLRQQPSPVPPTPGPVA